MRRWWIGALVVILALAAATMWRERGDREADAAPLPMVSVAPQPVEVLRALDLDAPTLRIEVLAVTRPARDIVEVRLAFTNRDAAAVVALGDRFAETPTEAGTLSGAFLTTASGTSRAFVLRDAAGAPQCSKGLEQLGPGERKEAWIRFASPGPASATVTLTVKNAPPLDGLVLPEAR